MKTGIVVSNDIEAKEQDSPFYKVYKVAKVQDMNTMIRKAMDEGCSSVLAFVASSTDAAMVSKDKAVRTFITKCNGITAGFYVKQAEMFIQAKIGLEDIYKSITQSLHNCSVR